MSAAAPAYKRILVKLSGEARSRHGAMSRSAAQAHVGAGVAAEGVAPEQLP